MSESGAGGLAVAPNSMIVATGIYSLIANHRLNTAPPHPLYLELAHASDVERLSLSNPVAMADLTQPPFRVSAIWECP
jgi:hypothetical protein